MLLKFCKNVWFFSNEPMPWWNKYAKWLKCHMFLKPCNHILSQLTNNNFYELNLFSCEECKLSTLRFPRRNWTLFFLVLQPQNECRGSVWVCLPPLFSLFTPSPLKHSTGYDSPSQCRTHRGSSRHRANEHSPDTIISHNHRRIRLCGKLHCDVPF